MANKFYNYRVRAVQSAAQDPMPQGGTGYLDFINTGSYKQFDAVVNIAAGFEERFTYRITAASESSKYEYGLGYITNVSSALRLTREKIYSSSQGSNDRVSWITADGPLTLDMMVPHPNNVSSKRLNSNTSLPNITTTYLVDATGNLTLSLPEITSADDAVAINLMITSLSGVQNERTDAVTLDAFGTNTINYTGTHSISKKNDLITIISDVDNFNWIILDGESDIGGSSGPDGSVQIADGGVVSNDTGLFYNNNALYIGGSGTNNASIELTASSGATFNLQNNPIDFAIHSIGANNTFFVDGSTNRVGMRTNSPLDIVHVNTTGVGGIFISNTGSGGVPVTTFKNTDPDFTDGTDIGIIDFVGVDDSSNDTTYGRILIEATDVTDISEEGQLNISVNHNGILQNVAQLSYDDIQIGPNNSITGGIAVGSSNINEGDNIVLGYSNTNCGNTSITVGHSNNITSGSYGGIFGTNHTMTGSYMWIFGGSGFDVTGNNTTYLVGDNNNYIRVKHNSQQRVGIYVDTTGTDFNIINTRVSTSGVEHNQNFVFNNSSGTAKTGVSYGIKVLDPTDGSENTKFFIKILETGTLKDVFDISSNNVNISNVSGFDNSVLIGSNLTITETGSNTVVIGMSNIISNNSGNNTIVGYNNELNVSGNDHTALLGNSNTIDENYTSTVGTSNRNSGLYSAVIGYNNGVYGENISSVGVNNDISGNNVSVIGYNNNIDNNGVYVIGQGNTSVYSGVHMIGNDIIASEHNTTIIKNDTVIITGTTVRFDANVELGVDAVASSGDNVSIFVNDAGYITGDAYVTGISYTEGTSSGILVLSHHSGSVTGILNGIVHTGQNISILTNDTGYLISGIDNVSSLVNDTGYITSNGYANPKITFSLTNTGINSIIFTGGGTQGSGIDETPDIYVYRGFTYDFDCDLGFPFQIRYLGSAYNSGLTNNTGVTSGVVTWNVRHDSHTSGIYYVSTDNPFTVSGNIYIA